MSAERFILMAMQSLLLLGRQQALGLAELESLFGARAVTPVGSNAALLAVDTNSIPFARLGSAIRAANVIAVLPSHQWRELEGTLAATVTEILDSIEGRLTLGISVFGIDVNARRISETALKMKKAARSTGHTIRIVPNKFPDLNSAQVIHNKLTGKNGCELLIVRDGNKSIIARTTAVQDIESYAARDQVRPYRDARVGMLPPKLAQLLINLATAQNQDAATILDPFCGTGVVLQEAMLMGYDAYGTDLEPRMIDYSKGNIEWLTASFPVPYANIQLEVADATNHQWRHNFQAVAAETYLGRPFGQLPKPEILDTVIRETNTILRKFLANISSQIPKNTRLALALPAWQIRPHQFRRLPLLDQIEKLGYNRVRFSHVRNEDLVYHRENQVVGRELVVLERK